MSAPKTLKFVVVPVTGFGVAVAGVATVGGDVALTVTLAVPFTLPLDAVTVYGPPGVASAVNNPAVLIVPPPSTFQLIGGCDTKPTPN